MKVLGTSARLPWVLLVVLISVLMAAGWQATATRGTRPAVAMTAECHQAYRGYMEASDPAEADFWAESWMTFGCETGGGYWA
jgi:hypothetical protein